MKTLAATLSVLGLALIVAAGAARAEERETLRSGSWAKKTYKVSGSFRIIADGEARVLEISADFRTKKGPDLKVFLSPRSLADVKSSNAMRDALRVGRLQKHEGKQRIAIPKGADLDRYRSILIHCEKYTVLFAAAALE